VSERDNPPEEGVAAREIPYRSCRAAKRPSGPTTAAEGVKHPPDAFLPADAI